MTEDEQLSELRRKHAELEAELEREQKNPATDYLVITELKKKKLQVKEQISRLSDS